MAEYSYDDVMTALRNADAAGDTEAATRLASIAQGLSKQTKPQESDWHSEILTGAKQGLQKAASSTAKLGANLAASGESLFTGTKDTDTLNRTTKAIDNFFGADKQEEMKTIPGLVAETATNVLPFAVNLPVAGIGMAGMYNDQVDSLVAKGVPLSDARKAAAANIAAMTAAGGAAGVATKKLTSGLLSRFAGGATGFAGGAEVGRQVQNALLEDHPEAQTRFDVKHAIAQGIVGGGLGLAHTQKPSQATKKPIREMDEVLAEDSTKQEQNSQGTGVRGLLPEFKENKEPILVDSNGEAVPMSQATNLELFKRNAEEQQRSATLEQPIEYEPGLKPYEPQTYLGEATRVEDGLPYVRETKSEALDTRLEDYKQRQMDFAESQRAFEEGHSSLSKEQAFAEMEKLKKEQEFLDELRRSLFEDEADNKLQEPSQHSIEIENPQERTTNRPSPNRGKFGQGGAIDPDVFLKDFPEFVNSVVKDAAGKLRVLYHGTSVDKIFDKFKNNPRGTFLTADPEVASMYARDNESKGPKYNPDTRRYEEQNTADRVMPVYVNIKNPYKLTPEETTAMYKTSNYAKMQKELRVKAEQHGYDGITYPDGSVVAFSPTQIVSATSPKIGQTSFGKGQRGSVDINGIWDGIGKLADGVRVLLSDGRKGVVVSSKQIPNHSIEAWTELRSKLNEQAFQGYVSGQHTFDQATQIYERLLEQNKDKLKQLYNQADGVRFIPKVLIDGESRPSSVLSPSSISKVFTGPLGQAKVGGNQRGSIGFFGKTPEEKFIAELRDNYPEATEQQLQRAVDKWKQNQQQAAEQKSKVTVAERFANKISPDFLNMWRDQHTNESAIEAIKNSEDNSTTRTGLLNETVGSKGRLGIQTHSNEGVKMGVGRMTTILDENGIESNRVLNDQNTGVNPILRNLESLFGEGKAADVFKYVFGKQIDPTAEMPLSKEQRTAVERIKKATDSAWDVVIESYKKLDPAKAEKLEKLKQEWYIPHKWNGDFGAYVQLKNPDGTPGKKVTFISENSMKEAQTAVDYYRKTLGGDYIVTDASYMGDVGRSLSKKSVEGIRGASMQDMLAGRFEAMLDLLTVDDLDVQQAQKAVQATLNRAAKTSEQMNNRLKINTNIGGYLGNKPWKTDRQNYFDAKETFEQYIEGVHTWKSAMEIADFLQNVKEAAPDKVKTYATLVNQFKQMMGLNREPKNSWVSDLKGWAAETTGYGGNKAQDIVHSASNIATAAQTGVWNYIMGLQNIIQAGVTSVNLGAILAAHGGTLNPVTLAGHILTAGKDVLFGRSARPEEYDYATQHEINKLGLLESHAKTKVGSNAKDWIVNKLTQQTEAVSRMSVFYGITDYLVSSGVDKQLAMEVSKNLTRDYMVNYEMYARPNITTQTGIIGQSLGRLQTFSANAFTQFAQSVQFAIKAAKENNPKMALPLVAFLGTSILTAGVNGTIPMDVAEKIFNGLQATHVLPPDWRSPRQYMLEEYPKASVGALSTITSKYFDPSFRSSIPFLGVPPVWGILGTRLSDAKSVLDWTGNYVSGKDTSQETKFKAARAVTPTGWRGIPEQKFMVDKQSGTYFSPTQELPQYTPASPKENQVLKYTNVRSLGRGLTSEVGFMGHERDTRIADAINSESKNLQKYITGQIRAGEEINPKNVVASLTKVFEYGGDVNKTVKHMTDLAAAAGYDNQLVYTAVKQAKKNPFRAKRAIEALNTIEGVTR